MNIEEKIDILKKVNIFTGGDLKFPDTELNKVNFTQIVDNLISNAFKVTPAEYTDAMDGKVWVESAPGKREFLFC